MTGEFHNPFDPYVGDFQARLPAAYSVFTFLVVRGLNLRLCVFCFLAVVVLK